MKTSSKFILKSFAGPFAATFFIAIFILLMQFVWKHIDDMVGKGLEWSVVLQLLMYISASLVPMALPLAILLSSLMTFGNLGENYELIAFKSAGISLKRILKALMFLIVLLSIAAFLFSNYILPVANLKSRSLLYDVREQKPTMDIRPGIFSSELEDFTIRVKDKKEVDEKEYLYDVLIYDHSKGKGNRSVITAERGLMTVSDDKRFLILQLFNGQNYDEQMETSRKKNYPLARSSFEEEILRFDLSQFALSRTDENLFKNNYYMLNLQQLDNAIDTLSIQREERKVIYTSGLRNSYYLFSNKELRKHSKPFKRASFHLDVFLNGLKKAQKEQIVVTALNLSRNSRSRVSGSKEDLSSRKEYINRHRIEWHKKLTLSFACIVLFLIGAPLGAIIRKGGLGMPMVISVIFFLIFHILSITGEKMAKEGAIPVFIGMWMATAILTPVGLFFTYKATTDSSFFKLDSYLSNFKDLFIKKKNQQEQ